jgi:hypothetical protein
MKKIQQKLLKEFKKILESFEVEEGTHYDYKIKTDAGYYGFNNPEFADNGKYALFSQFENSQLANRLYGVSPHSGKHNFFRKYATDILKSFEGFLVAINARKTRKLRRYYIQAKIIINGACLAEGYATPLAKSPTAALLAYKRFFEIRGESNLFQFNHIKISTKIPADMPVYDFCDSSGNKIDLKELEER